MEVQLVIKSWRIVKDVQTSLPRVAGSYGVMMGEREIASQDFNEGYACKSLAFSVELLKKLREVETLIVAEIQKMLI